MSLRLVMSQGLFRCTVAKSSLLPSSDGDVTVILAGALTRKKPGEYEKFPVWPVRRMAT
jgi:hypothetical protein